LERVRIPAGVSQIGGQSFYRAGSLGEVTFESRAAAQGLSIGEEAFAWTGIERIVLPQGVSRIERGVFRGTESLREINLWGVNRIEAEAFAGSGLREVFLGSNIWWLGENIFRNTSGLVVYAEATIRPSGWHNDWSGNAGVVWGAVILDGGIFALNGSSATLLRHLGTWHTHHISQTVPIGSSQRTVTRIASGAFYGSYVRNLYIPGTVSYIEGGAFAETREDFGIRWTFRTNVVGMQYMRPYIEEIILPNNATRIGDGAFRDFERLLFVSMPANLNSIGRDAFYNTAVWNNAADGEVVYVGRWAVGVRGQLVGDVSLLSDTIGIADGALQNQEGLIHIVIPSSVLRIGTGVLGGADNAIILAARASRPSGWHSNWNPDNRPIYWGTSTIPQPEPPPSQSTVITTQAQLAAIAGSDGYFVLGGDITLSGNWSPIAGFRGELDGRGYAIRGLRITYGGLNISQGSYVNLGLFGRLYGSVTNLNIVDARITVGSGHGGTGWLRAGVLAAWAGSSSRISNVHVSDATIIADRCLSQIGGLVGFSRAIIANNTITNLELRGNGDKGGIVGFAYSDARTIDNEVSNMVIWHWSVHATRSVGGVAGFQRGGGIHSNTVSGLTITTNGPNPPAIVGGILGVQDMRHGIPLGGYISGNTVAESTVQGAALTAYVGGRLG